MKTPVLRIRGLHIRRGGTPILRNLDWTIHHGEHWVILGANGSGKTSLLSALTAYLTPSEGSIELLGEEYGGSDWRELRKKVGMVSTALTRHVPPSETAMDTVLSGLHSELGMIHSVTKADRIRAGHCLGLLGIRHLAGRPWEVLSQGERQKVFIARALLPSPALLILDEPCAGLDPVAREKFLLRLQKLATRRHGPAIVLVTHHVEEIIPAVTHALLLKSGRVHAAGPVESTLTETHLERIFGHPVRLRQSQSRRWEMHLGPFLHLAEPRASDNRQSQQP